MLEMRIVHFPQFFDLTKGLHASNANNSTFSIWKKFSSCQELLKMCGSRKYPYPLHGWFFNFYPPPPSNFPSRGSFVDPPTPRNFHFFWRGFFFKLTTLLSLNKSENTSFITKPLPIICCTHYNNIS